MIRNLIRNKTVFAVLSIAMGVFMCIAGRGFLDGIVRVAGYALLGAAAAYLVMYFFGNSRSEVQIGYAILAGILGLVIVGMAPAIVKLFPRLAGIGLVLVGAVNLLQASQEGAVSGTSKVGAALTIALGALIFLKAGFIMNMVVVAAGVGLILNGLSELDMIRKIW